MANLLRKLGSKLRNFLKPKPPKLETRVIGHRGVAAGSVKKRAEAGGVSAHEITYGQGQFGQIGVEASRAAFTPEELAAWELLPPNEVEAFVKHRHVLLVNSSNVHAMQFLPDTHEMIVGFDGGGSDVVFYQYSNVSDAEALQFAQATSKGGIVWDILRIRGTKTGHKKPYRKVGGFVKTTPRAFRG